MNGKERIKAAMDLKEVSPVPFMCQMSIGHMLVQLDVSPLEFWFDKNVYRDGLVNLERTIWIRWNISEFIMDIILIGKIILKKLLILQIV